MNRYQLRFRTVHGVEKASRVGIDGPDAEVHHRQPRGNIVVLKVPGHHYWSAIGTQSYAPAEFIVLKQDDDYPNWYHVIASFPVRKIVKGER